jgi:FkbM family methyltransferase
VSARAARARGKTGRLLEAAGLFPFAEAVLGPLMVQLDLRRLRSFYGSLVRPGDLVFDIGANVGRHSLVFLELGARIVAVEPQQGCIERLERALAGKQAVVESLAVGDRPGRASLFLNSLSHERATLCAEHVATGRFSRGWEGAEEVEVTTLDLLISRHGVPDLCKIDVEALEPKVLGGLTVPIAMIVFEFHEGLPGTGECLQLLRALGPYEFNYRVGRSGRLSADRWLTSAGVYDHMVETPNLFGDVVARLRSSPAGS